MVKSAVHLNEFTGTGSVPAIDGAGLSFQPKPRSAVSSLLGDDDDEPVKPKKKLKEDDTEKMKADIEKAGHTRTRVELVNQLRNYYFSSDAQTVRDFVESFYGDDVAHDLTEDVSDADLLEVVEGFERRAPVAEAAKPKLTASDLWEGGPAADTTQPAAVLVPQVESGPPSLRSFFDPGTPPSGLVVPQQKISEAEVSAMAATILPATAESGIIAEAVLVGAGEALMRGGAVPPPTDGDGRRLVAQVHQFLASS